MYVSNEVIDSRKIFRVSIFALIYFDVVDQQQMHKYFLAKPFAPQLI